MGNPNLYHIFSQHFPADRAQLLLDTADGRQFSYGDIDRLSARMAHVLVDAGLSVGDRVTVQIDKSPEGVALYLACLRAGLVYHPLNTAYQRSELAFFLENAEPSAIVCSSAYRATLQALAGELSIAKLFTLDADGSGSLSERCSNYPDHFTTVQNAADSPAALLYSSGTTGRPKGIVLSHGNLSANAATLVQLWGFNSADVLLHALPIFHVHGLFVAINCVLMSGSRMHFLPAFQVDAVLQSLSSSSVMMGVPTYYTRLLAAADFDREACAAMRLFISGSAPLLAETFHAFQERTGHTILERYGMTETGMNTSNPLYGKRKAGTVGPPLPDVTLRIVDDTGKLLATGETGNVQVRGPNVFSGYWRLPEKTAEDITADGFFNTGDQGLIDADGYVAIVGRAKDMIICGGLNVYPKEIELLIDDLPGVAESAVIGVPHPDFGEAVLAVVVRAPGEVITAQDIIAFARAELANFKVPKRVEFVEELPRNTMGKVQKALLREQFSYHS